MRTLSRLCALATGLVVTSTGAARDEETRISNIAIRAQGGVDTPLIAGFTLGPGPAKTVLIRAVGPSLEALGVTDALADPKLAIFDAKGARIAENEDFSAAAADAFALAGAFPLRSGGKDAALVATLPPGNYTAQVTGSTAGFTLLEVYDVSGGTASMVNLSTRTVVTSGAGPVITGITVAPGAGTQRLLIRAIGPTLESFGLATSEVLPDPKIEVYAGTTKLADNDNWSGLLGEPYPFPWSLARAFAQAGAFTLPMNSRDAALVHDFPAGSYTVVIHSPDGGRGQVMVEMFALPPAAGPVFPTTAGMLALEDFTVTVRKVGELYEYIPSLRFVETGRMWAVIVSDIHWTVEHDGTVESLPPWKLFLRIPAAGTYEFPVGYLATLYRPLSSLHEFSRISVRIACMDDDLAFDHFDAVARLIR